MYNMDDGVFGAKAGRGGTYGQIVFDAVERLGGDFDTAHDTHLYQHHLTYVM
ncbi:MAG: hypothetical protein P8K08_24185 [Fuerstiella sp.]|jgi:hypothetical protein|nr:hypothetical protein [Fuerstiella sp.]